MPSEVWRSGPDSPVLSDKERLRALASRQFGVVARYQLLHLGIPGSVIGDWARSAVLARLHRAVYAVGHTALSTEARLTAAVLYAGPDAMLSDATAAWWLSLTDRRPPDVHVSTPRRCRDTSGVVVHDRRAWPRTWHRGLPVAPLHEVLLAYAASATAEDLRYALAQAEYRGYLKLDLWRPGLGQGRAGAAALRKALAAHQPRLAMTRSLLERRLLALCERSGLPAPRVNAVVEGHRVDALWAAERVIVEVDGRDGHRTWAQRQRDLERDLRLRRAGYLVLRYTWAQITERPAEVAADVAAALSSAARWAG